DIPMGLIKSIFGAIFGLIGGIFKTIGGLVGLGKKSEFFMELDEANSSQSAIAPSAPAPAAKTEPAAADKAPVKAAAQTTPNKKETTPPAKQETKAPAPAAPSAEPVPTGFASTYLTSVGTALPRRRRPGPSLSPFMDMAKQVKAR
ncbi:MAG: hypothetical protein WBA99_09945, partial [Nodosilinea sp.]